MSSDFNAIRISLASPEQIRLYSYGEVTKPETINYRTLRPEKDGLFCEKIFGPTKDWECFCGKFKKIRHRGVKCDRCGVEVARAKVRRERMGHIDLAAPVAHIWFSKGLPSRIGLMLDLTPRNLERVLYFAQYVVTKVDAEARDLIVNQLQKDLSDRLEIIESTEREQTKPIIEQIEKLEQDRVKVMENSQEEISEADQSDLQSSIDRARQTLVDLQSEFAKSRDALKGELGETIDDLKELRVTQLLPEGKFRDLSVNYGEIFSAGMGAEAILEILQALDLDFQHNLIQTEMHNSSGQRRKKAIKRLRLVEALRKSENKPEWMILTMLPVLPPELRPMVQLDGGRFATSDLNDLYRRVINRNNRLKRLIELSAPDIILRNEKRMLQEAVDALIDNGRRGRAVAGGHNHKLKSLSDLLRGKQGRFRQNLLGKRVDYSGRSVIVSGPDLLLNQCGLPRRMALELFKPFVMNRLVMRGYAHNIKSAKRLAESATTPVWDILDEVVKERPVLLNRAPTLHRLGIQAFESVLIDGSAIQLHPLVCTAFNADFDGDQMAVHVPLSKVAVLEARNLMMSTHNMLAPSSGEPIVSPTLDIVLGCYYLTAEVSKSDDQIKEFANFHDAQLAYDLGELEIGTLVKVRYQNATQDIDAKWIETTVGRIIFNEILPPEIPYINKIIDDKELKSITARIFTLLSSDRAAQILDAIKGLGFHYASRSGITVAINDIQVSDKKTAIISSAEEKVADLETLFMDGLITEEERKQNVIGEWSHANDELTEVIAEDLHNYGGFYMMTNSGAKGNISQLRQMAGWRGLMSNPRGEIMELPVRASYREGLSVLEYFISTHGARKGLTDTALRTADSGYLTRRLIDVSQELIIIENDCGTLGSVTVFKESDDDNIPSFDKRLRTRSLSESILDPKTGELLLDRNHMLNDESVSIISNLGLESVQVRSPLTCETENGICKLCYGLSMSTLQPVLLGEAVGIIAAQSIGEPGTQLTMRTFHVGGAAFSGADITTGLPRVEEIFEARIPKGAAALAETEGTIQLEESIDGERIISVKTQEDFFSEHVLPEGHSWIVKDGSEIQLGDSLSKVSKKVSPKTAERKLAKINKEIESYQSKIDGLQTNLSTTPPAETISGSIATEIIEVFTASASGTPSQKGAATRKVSKLLINNGASESDAKAFVKDTKKLFSENSEDPAKLNESISVQLAIIVNSENKQSPADAKIQSQISDLKQKITEISEDAEELNKTIESIYHSESIISFSDLSGIISIKDNLLTITSTEEDQRDYQIPLMARLEVNQGQTVNAGDALTTGPKDPHMILKLRGTEAVYSYLIGEVQKVYGAQGVTIHDKHIEVILGRMMRKVRVDQSGDTSLLPDELIEIKDFEEVNGAILAEGGEPATATPVLLGVTRASLQTESFLSAASFQETTRVLTESAIKGSSDHLRGLKENVIIGRLIPAQLTASEEGRQRLGLPELEAEIEADAAMKANELLDIASADMREVMNSSFGHQPFDIQNENTIPGYSLVNEESEKNSNNQNKEV